jgi:hypothetical protein
MTTAWTGDWKARIADRLRDLGCAGMSQFIAMFPRESFYELSKRLGDDVAPIQMEAFLAWEGHETGRDREIAMECLVRLMYEHNRRGWNKGRHASFRQSSVLSKWLSVSVLAENVNRFRVEKEQVWKALKDSQPPEGWLPESAQDSFIQQAFTKGWPLT